MARACAARYRKQARGACQAAATALAVVASGLALMSVLLPVLAGAATIVTGVGPAARALGTGAAAALGLGAWALVRGMTATRRPAGRKAWRRSGTGCGRRCAAAVALAAAALWIGGAAAWKNTAAPTLAGAGAVVLAGAAVKVALARVGALPFAVLAAAAAFALGEPPETAAALLGAGAVSVVYRLAASLVRCAAAPRARAPSECLRRLVLWGVPLACVDGALRRLLVAAAAVYYAFPGAARRWRRASDRRRSRRRWCRAARVARVAVLVLGPLDGVASAAARRNPSQRCPRPLVASRTGPTRTSSRDGASAARRTAQTTASSKRCGTRRAPPDALIAPARSGTSTRCDGPWASRSARRCRATRCIDSPTCWASSSCSCTTRGRPATAAPGRVAGAPWSRWTAPATSFTPSGPD